MKLNYKKRLPHIFWTVVAIVAGVLLGPFVIQKVASTYGKIYQEIFLSIDSIPVFSPTKPPIAEAQTREENITIGFVGDIIPSVDVTPAIFESVTPYTEKPDVMIGNFEGVIPKENDEYKKCESRPTNCFAFKGTSYFIELLQRAGFDVLNIANNHANDFGTNGQKNTIAEITNAGILASGVKDKVVYIEKNNITLGVVGFSTYEWATNMNNSTKVKELINEAKENSDAVVVIFHGGAEGAKFTHVTYDTEWHLGENRGDLRSFAHAAIDAGASLVLGSGPHVLRGMERYNGKVIAYSLGNFALSDSSSVAELLRTSAMLTFNLNKNGDVLSGEIIPVKINTWGDPHPYEGDAISIINSLSLSDFGDSGILFHSDGKMAF